MYSQSPIGPMAEAFDLPTDAPQTIGDYTLSEILGSGSFGTVRLGLHRETSKRVAVKILEKEGAADEHSLRRISAEISTMERISRGCPFIVQLYEVLLSSTRIFLVMEIASDGELFPRLHAGEVPGCASPHREQRVRSYFQQLVLGVQWCHMQGIIPRRVARPHMRGPCSCKARVVGVRRCGASRSEAAESSRWRARCLENC